MNEKLCAGCTSTPLNGICTFCDRCVVLAIDPGNIESGFCVIGEDYRPLYFGKVMNEELLDRIKGMTIIVFSLGLVNSKIKASSLQLKKTAINVPTVIYFLTYKSAAITDVPH